MKMLVASLVSTLILIALPALSPAHVDRDDDTPHRFPAKLSETGYYTSTADKTIAPDFESYEINIEAWADGAKKQRFVRLPDGRRATFKKSDAWTFPDDTVFLQTLHLPREKGNDFVETRIIVIKKGKPVFGTYAWDDDDKDATLVLRGKEFYAKTDTGSLLWTITSTTRCARCHNEVSGPLLGLTTEQLNRETTTDRGPRSQIALMAEKRLVDAVPMKLGGLPKLASPHDKTVPLATRARNYLHTNCAMCHQPGGRGSGTLDLRRDTPFALTGMTEENDEALVIGDPFRSWVYLRMVYTDRSHMPNVLTQHVDDDGAKIVRDWIAAMTPVKKVTPTESSELR